MTDINETAVKVKYITTIDGGFAPLVEWMAKEGSSFLLNYGEDTGAWECSWILRGERYIGNSMELIHAVRECLKMAGLIIVPGSTRNSSYLDIYRKPLDD
jgi:hypothetical protein